MRCDASMSMSVKEGVCAHRQDFVNPNYPRAYGEDVIAFMNEDNFSSSNFP